MILRLLLFEIKHNVGSSTWSNLRKLLLSTKKSRVDDLSVADVEDVKFHQQYDSEKYTSLKNSSTLNMEELTLKIYRNSKLWISSALLDSHRASFSTSPSSSGFLAILPFRKIYMELPYQVPKPNMLYHILEFEI